jgi:heme A synthase
MVWAIAGLNKWVDGGGVFDKAVIESEGTPPFPEAAGITAHINNGFFVIPALALLLLIVSFFTKVRGTIKWAGIVLALVVVQVMLGILGHEFTLGGALHGLNALALFGTAIYAGRRLRAMTPAAVEQPEAHTATPVS